MWYLSNGIDKPFFEMLLAAFARETGAGRDRIIILVLDNAGWHSEPGLAVPDGIRLFYLPPYTPQLQPAERLWPLVDEPLVNRYFETLDELDAALAEERDAVEQLRERRAALEAELARLEEVEAQRQAEERRRQEEEARRQTVAAGRTSSTPDDDERPAPTLSSGGGIVCPVAGAHTFVDSWGAPRSGGRRHQGVDMMARPGVPTVAPVSGRVEHRGNSTGGMSWHLYGDNGDYYYGTHLSAYENQGAGHVEAGTVIGYVGDSGNARGISHLHFEIHPGGGGAVNPYPAVAGAC